MLSHDQSRLDILSLSSLEVNNGVRRRGFEGFDGAELLADEDKDKEKEVHAAMISFETPNVC